MSTFDAILDIFILRRRIALRIESRRQDRQNPTPAARSAFVQHLKQAAQSGKITLQESDALIGMMGIVY